MKQVFLMCCLLLCGASLQAQNFAPIGAQWFYGSGGFGESHGAAYYRYEATKDTILAEQSCTKIARTAYDMSGDSSLLYPYFVYQSNDTVFYYNHYHSQFFPLYFFNVQAGDTLTFYQPEPISPSIDLETWQCVVDSVTTFIVGDDTLKRIVTHDMEPLYATYSFHGGYTEKFGCRRMMLPTTFNIIFEGDGGLRCYSDSAIAQNFTSKPCDYRNSTSAPSLQETTTFALFPNPTTDYLNVTVSNGLLSSYTICNLVGKNMRRGSFQGQARIELNGLPSGYYLFFLETQGGRQLRHFMIP